MYHKNVTKVAMPMVSGFSAEVSRFRGSGFRGLRFKDLLN
jgi:hypothetical protein